MKQVATHANRFVDYLIAAVLVLEPFYAFITVWGSSLVGLYTELRLWDDMLLLILLAAVSVWLAQDAELRSWFVRSLLVRLIIAYVVLMSVLGAIALAKGEVSHRALTYGLLVDVRFPLWFLGVLLAGQRSNFLRQHWPRLIVIPAAVVVLFAALQYTVLPHNFLSHFGYGPTTITPIETINHNNKYIRVASTLRGANPLGAYLVIIGSALAVLWLYGRRKALIVVLAILTMIALYATGSRSAWIGVAISITLLIWLRLRTQRGQLVFGGLALIVVAIGAVGYLMLKHNVRLQNEVLHTQTNSAVQATSDGAHANALKNGITDVAQQPFGAGPGTAGPASIYNTGHPARIAEDYYIQIGQEAGWLGLAIFLCILGLTALELYEQADHSRLALLLFISFFGVGFVNLLSHAWADDTLAYIWWGLAGVALAKPFKKPKSA